ncbi:hypothetical protein H6758_02400 [Candidatus Nomurabacteria bacterium]|nr:hypothetical protein [Candidatus Nomurabacteria bacterium]
MNFFRRHQLKIFSIALLVALVFFCKGASLNMVAYGSQMHHGDTMNMDHMTDQNSDSSAMDCCGTAASQGHDVAISLPLFSGFIALLGVVFFVSVLINWNSFVRACISLSLREKIRLKRHRHRAVKLLSYFTTLFQVGILHPKTH